MLRMEWKMVFHTNHIDSPICQNLQKITKYRYYQTKMWIIKSLIGSAVYVFSML